MLLERKLTTLDDVRHAAGDLGDPGCDVVVIKGGHPTIDTPDVAVDVWFDGTGLHELSGPRLDTADNHGTGCSFASAVAARRASGGEGVCGPGPDRGPPVAPRSRARPHRQLLLGEPSMSSTTAIAALLVTLAVFAVVGATDRARPTGRDDYLSARSSLRAVPLALSLYASGIGVWIVFTPPIVAASPGSSAPSLHDQGGP